MKINIIDQVGNVNDDNSDVEVELDGKKYTATFFTIKNIESIMLNYRTSGECLNGKYFWSSDMIIIDDLKEDTIKKVVEELISAEEFYDIFNKS